MAPAKPVDKKLVEEAKKELKRYRIQQRLRLVKTLASSGILAVVFLVVFGLALGGAFEGFLGLLGLTPFKNEARGLYADCTRPENRESRYCQSQSQSQSRRAYENDWRQVANSGRGSAKFRLTE